MKVFFNFYRFIAAVFIFICSAQTVHSQNVNGRWYGIGNPDIPGSSNSYLCEFIITQNGDQVSGYFNYFFRNGYFSNKLTGSFNEDKRLLLLKPMPILYHLSENIGTGVDCIMTGVFTLKVAKQNCTLSGMFESDDFHKYTSPPVKVNFYKLKKGEPDLKERIKSKALILEAPPQKPVVQAPAPTPAPIAPIITETEKEVKLRANAYIRILDVTADSVDVDLYDNGQFDYDSVSIFYNNKMIVHQQQLSTRIPISFKVFVDSSETKNDLLMFAENLGLIPPNSAIMIVRDKNDRYEIPLQSNYQKNGAVRLRRAAKPAVITH